MGLGSKKKGIVVNQKVDRRNTVVNSTKRGKRSLHVCAIVIVVVAERGITRIGNVMMEMVCDDEWERINRRRGIVGKEFLDDYGVQVKTDKLGKE